MKLYSQHVVFQSIFFFSRSAILLSIFTIFESVSEYKHCLYIFFLYRRIDESMNARGFLHFVIKTWHLQQQWCGAFMLVKFMIIHLNEHLSLVALFFFCCSHITSIILTFSKYKIPLADGMVGSCLSCPLYIDIYWMCAHC